MDDATLEKALRRGWILALVGMLWIVAHFLLAFHTSRPEPAAEWDMGGTPFVPASSIEADGYPVTPPPAWPQPTEVAK